MTTLQDDDIWEKLQEIFRDIFNDDTLEITTDTRASDIPAWDSLTNIRLIVSIEMEFGIKFNTSEVADVQNAGELVALINKLR